jgi:hypothetical protein
MTPYPYLPKKDLLICWRFAMFQEGRQEAWCEKCLTRWWRIRKVCIYQRPRILPMPHENLGGRLVNEGQHIDVFNTSRSERKSKIFYWKVECLIGKLCIMSSRSSWEHLIGAAILLCIFVRARTMGWHQPSLRGATYDSCLVGGERNKKGKVVFP